MAGKSSEKNKILAEKRTVQTEAEKLFDKLSYPDAPLDLQPPYSPYFTVSRLLWEKEISYMVIPFCLLWIFSLKELKKIFF